MAIELNDFIKVYDNVLEPNICNFLINLFEQNVDNQERIENDKKPNFTQFNLTENSKISEEVNNVHNFLISKVFEYKKKYYEFIDDRCFPEKHNFEQFRIKKYNPETEDQFDTHVDVIDYASSRRFLSFMWYLNDVDNGGETVFENLTIRPKQGSMLVFPPLWTFPHRGNPPVSNLKYIMSTYLHYK
jgi:prolyl 4-hydroxylase